ncbi:hypothetical protein DPEC_G00288320 [Dallia pectoralis]|uniref:Uncharacterized protein n=1 Tax=Dallia pectoralis TaxID=75939 RepID=A0ACC2FKE4_DALPE|nr:hypothetical protein DPEC_G00288320 [Dallia pectoralis]
MAETRNETPLILYAAVGQQSVLTASISSHKDPRTESTSTRKSFRRLRVSGTNCPPVQIRGPCCETGEEQGLVGSRAGPGKAGRGPHVETTSLPLDKHGSG